MSTTSPPRAPAATRAGAPPPPAPDAPQLVASPARARRRPLVVAVGIVAVALGALVSAWAYTSASTTQPVIAVREQVGRGQVITEADLVAVRTSIDPALRTLPASKTSSVVGQRAATDLLAGSLLTPAAITPALVPAQGRSVVGLALSSAKMPAAILTPGDAVRVISTPPTGAPAPTGATAPEPAEVAAQVVAVAQAPDVPGTSIVNVEVDSASAAALAARAATGEVAVVLEAREG